jgi:hypothetical protein
MSQILVGFFGAAATVLTLGAVQLPSDQDPVTSVRNIAPQQIVPIATATTVNRAAKADRTVALRQAPAPTRTVSIRLHGLANTSVVLRIPQAQEARNTKPPALLPARMQNRKPTVACEPVVSVLTDVAKLLQPGRCVT